MAQVKTAAFGTCQGAVAPTKMVIEQSAGKSGKKNNWHAGIETLAQWSFTKSTRLAELLPHAAPVILQGCGHAMLAEQPDLVLDQLNRVV